MKRGLIIAASILTSLSSAAQDFSKYTPGTMGEGVVYYLPKTEIELEVVATKVGALSKGQLKAFLDANL